jgi:hypothetical protein
MVSDLVRRIGPRESARWTGIVGYDRKRLEAIAPDGARRTIAVAEIVFADAVETFKNARGVDLVRASYPQGRQIETFKPYWLA